MTTMAAMLSGLPLMLENGAGSELRRPLGFAMVGGLVLSQVADALHDAGDLSLSRPAAALAGAATPPAPVDPGEKLGEARRELTTCPDAEHAWTWVLASHAAHPSDLQCPTAFPNVLK